MANSALITRRAAFVGALASSAALVVPAVAAMQHTKNPTAGLTPLETAKYHAAQARKAMMEVTPGNWVFTVDPSLEFVLINLIHNRYYSWEWEPTHIPGFPTPPKKRG